MELNHLREFLVLARVGNFLEAAETLFISQSTLSKHIKNLEAELGVPLFDRTTRKVELGQYGRILLPYAEQMLRLQKQYSTDLTAALEKERNFLEVGSIPALAPYKITDVVAQYKRECQGVRLHITQAGSQELRDSLYAGKCELAFIRETAPAQDGLERIPYDMDTLVAVLPLGHPCSNFKTIALTELRDEEFLLIEKNTMLYNLCLEACRQCGFEPKIAFTDHKLDHLIDFVHKGMGVALLMKKLAVHIANPHVCVVELSPKVETRISLCYKKGRKLSAAARHFIRCAKHVRTVNRHRHHAEGGSAAAI